MIQVKLTKDSKLGKKNSVILVTRNIAHGLVEREEAKIYKPKRGVYKNTMMSTKSRRYKRKG